MRHSVKALGSGPSTEERKRREGDGERERKEEGRGRGRKAGSEAPELNQAGHSQRCGRELLCPTGPSTWGH